MKLWDIKAKLYNQFRKPWPLSWILTRETEIISNLLTTIPNKTGRVLDVGCGVGHSTKLLHSTFEIVAVDKSKNMVRHAKDTALPVALDAHQLAFQNNSFDLILCVGLSEYVQDLTKLKDSLLKVLKPKGYLILTSSPKNIFGLARIIGGCRLFLRDSEDVTSCFKANRFSILQHQHVFSMDAFLLQIK